MSDHSARGIEITASDGGRFGAYVAIVTFQGDKLVHEHIYWD